MDAELFVASDMYDLSRLRSICEVVLKSKVDEDNAADLLLLAYLQVKDILKLTANYDNSYYNRTIFKPRIY